MRIARYCTLSSAEPTYDRKPLIAYYRRNFMNLIGRKSDQKALGAGDRQAASGIVLVIMKNQAATAERILGTRAKLAVQEKDEGYFAAMRTKWVVWRLGTIGVPPKKIAWPIQQKLWRFHHPWKNSKVPADPWLHLSETLAHS